MPEAGLESMTSTIKLGRRGRKRKTGNNSESRESGNKRVDKIESMFELFDANPAARFAPTNYNPFEIKHRKRTSSEQYKVLEAAFRRYDKPPLAERRAIAASLGMSNRAVQVWFQNRRAKIRAKEYTVEERKRGDPNLKVKRSASCPEITLPFEPLQEALIAERTARKPSECKPPEELSPSTYDAVTSQLFFGLDLDSLPLSPQSSLLEELCGTKEEEEGWSMDDLHSKLFAILPAMSPLDILYPSPICHPQEEDSPLQMFLNDMNCASPNPNLTS